MTPAIHGTPDYMLALKAAHGSIAGRAAIDFDAFAASMARWECYPVRAAGAICGAVFVKDGEIHACVMPVGFGLWLTRPVLSLVAQTIRRFGVAFSRAVTADGQTFLRRLGFATAGFDIYVRAHHGR